MFSRLIVFFLFSSLSLLGQEAFLTGSDTICSNTGNARLEIDFFRGTPPYKVVYSINGVQEQDTIITDNNPYILYTKKEGLYNLVYFEDFDHLNGMDSIKGMALIHVNPAPTAIINFDSDTISVLEPTVSMFSLSTGNIINTIWDFGDGSGFSYDLNTQHTYFTGDITNNTPFRYFPVTLIVEDLNGCIDTNVQNILLRQVHWISIPTAFTPNYDGQNDEFCIAYQGIRENTFVFNVYNDRGQVVFQSTNPLELKCGGGWNGKFKNNIIPSELYVYEMYYQDFDGWKHRKYGDIFLIR